MLSRPSSRGLRGVGLAASILVSGLALAGCAVERDPVPAPTSEAPVDPIEQPRSTPGGAPEFVEGGTAAENLDYFVFRLDALLAALDSGHVANATLDVFRVEPLPQEHLFWHHPRVTVTPHIASETRANTASRVIAENVRRGESGEPFLHLVDRDQGY